jgi:hypothetical protein
MDGVRVLEKMRTEVSARYRLSMLPKMLLRQRDVPMKQCNVEA